MDKQTTIAFILIGAILVLWLYLTAPTPTDQTQKKETTSLNKDTTQSVKEDSVITVNSTKVDSTSKLLAKTPQTAKEEFLVIQTDLSRIELSNKGADFKKVFLKKFNNWYSSHKKFDEEDYNQHVQLINYSRGGSYDIAFVSADGRGINTGELTFQKEGNKSYYKISGKDSVVIKYTFELETGKQITKAYTFYGDKYQIKSDINFVGFNNLISNNTYDVVWNNGIRFVEENSVDEANSSDAGVFYGDEHVIIDATAVGEKETKEFRGTVEWLAVRNKYFAAILIPDNSAQVEGAYIEGTREVTKDGGFREFYNARFVLPFKNLENETKSFTIYVGPVDYDILTAIKSNLSNLINFGSFFGLKFIVRPIAEYVLLPLLRFLHSFIPNYGIVIIVFSIIIKIVVYPLTKTSYQSMKKMQALQPKITELKERLKDDPQKMNKETMKLYSTYGVNPAGGCLPILLQMPIFIALWGLFQAAIELRQQPFMLWINDLSKPDVIYDLGFKLPLVGVQQISGLALLMGITTFVQQKMSVKDPKQQALIYIMPVMLTLLFMSFPSGLNLYYFMFNVLSIAQQYYINHKGGEVELVPVANPNKKKGFMSKLMEAADQQSKTQQKKRK